MFELFVGSKIDFMGKRRVAYIVSAVLVLASLGSLIAHGGPRESIDFTGGMLLDVQFNRTVNVGEIRSAAQEAGILGAEIQMVEGGEEALLRINPEQAPENPFIALKSRMEQDQAGLTVELRRTETVGPKVGDELERKATLAVLTSLGLILLYIAWRFTRFSFGIASVIALFHDILITLGIFSFLNLEVSLTVVAAFLTIGGYSINDTIIVFDRIRENRGLIKRRTFEELVNISINQTLARTVLTSGTTLVAVASLYFLGGIVIHDFAFAMLVGVVVGTYSSIYVAGALAVDMHLWWEKRKAARAQSATAKDRAAKGAERAAKMEPAKSKSNPATAG
jgi:preprotein translocase subunit SecF